MGRITVTLSVTIGLLFLAPVETVTRSEILARAESFAALTWFADSANTTAWDSMFACYGCTEHQTSDWTAGETYQGMAYSYGGNDDTVTYIEKLDDDLAAGNHMCHYQGYGAETGIYPPDWSTGIDCSAFVCRCWGVPRTNTGGIYDEYYALDKADVQPGDVLVKPSSHTVLIVDPGANPPYGTLALYEASGSACRVWYNPAASWSAYASYSARSLFEPGVDEDDGFVFDPHMQIICEPSVAKGRVLLRFADTWNTETISFEIFNVLGERVYTGEVEEPSFQVYWHGIDDRGRKLPSGVYGVRSSCPRRSNLVRLILLH